MSVISLLTDFGTQDSYVGVMKGVILGLHPRAKIVDISHEVRQGDVAAAALHLEAAYAYFPKGTVHVAVVDPEVGSERRILCAKADEQYFILPDNGLITLVARREKNMQVRRLENPKYFLKKISSTFHGRDKYSPAAAHLSRRDIFRDLGPRVDDYKKISWHLPIIEKDKIQGRIVHADHFGNLITNIEKRHLSAGKKPLRVLIEKQEVSRKWVDYYSQGREGEVVMLLNSGDRVEVAVYNGSAAKKIGTGAGKPAALFFK